MLRGVCAAAVLAVSAVWAAAAGPPGVLSRAQLEDRCRGFWLGQCIANWTGLRTEGRRTTAPFYTDDDWPETFDGRTLRFVTDQNPWRADDDTDIEYVYLHLADELGDAGLTPAQIRAGWIEHINRFIWVSNAEARKLMDRGVAPPETSMIAANRFALRIDAQLTTEIFGVFAPGAPDAALRLADFPIRATAAGSAMHAAQFFVVMFSMAPVAPEGLEGAGLAEWLVVEARKWIPDTSKTADIADTVLADWRDNPDRDDWERTRDLVYRRYQRDAAVNGFTYRGWTESGVNFGSTLVALLYGEMDFRRSVQIGTLTGWDSDNPTATVGALIGYALGADAVERAFPGEPMSDRYDIDRTRDGLPDRLPDDEFAQDRLSWMAQRTADFAEAGLLASGGTSSPSGDWLVAGPHPLSGGAAALPLSPSEREMARSATWGVRGEGGQAVASSSVESAPTDGGSRTPARIANGLESDASGREPGFWEGDFYSTQGAMPPAPPGAFQTLTVEWDRPVQIEGVRFIEGDHFYTGEGDAIGGWFTDASLEVRVDGVWTAVGAVNELDAFIPFQRFDVPVGEPMLVTGVRVVGAVAGGTPGGAFVTCAELDGLRPLDAPPERPSFDLDGDGMVDVDDLYSWERLGRDLTGDGVIDEADRSRLAYAVRVDELERGARE